MKKKVLAVALTVCMALGAVGCGAKETPEPTTEQTVTETENVTTATTEEPEAEEPEPEPEGPQVELGVNFINNGDFSDGTTSYHTYTNGGSCTISTSAGELVVDIAKTGAVDYGVQIYQDGFELIEGVEYEFSFDAYTDFATDRPLQWRLQINGGDYHAYAGETITLGTEKTSVCRTFTMMESSDPAPRMCFNLGYFPVFTDDGMTVDTVPQHKVFIDNICLKAVNAVNAVAAEAGPEIPEIKVDQVGYTCEMAKKAVFTTVNETTFEVRNAAGDAVVFSGKLSDVQHDPTSEQDVKIGDFSEVNTPGTYYVCVPSGSKSFNFTVGDDVYDDTLFSVTDMLRLQRCGEELTDAGVFNHAACHTEIATIYGTTDKKDVTGGWHDAGDYGRYVVPGAKTVMDLMLTYQLYDDADTELLDIAKYELDWMLKMQETNGGVYHKVTCEMFPSTVVPEEETDELFLSPISKTATMDFAAVMARAFRVYGAVPEYKDFAKTCLKASKKAYEYYLAHSDERNFTNPSTISTGEYKDGCSADEQLWAAAELYVCTQDGNYLEDMQKALSNKYIEDFTGLGWRDVAGYGIYTILSEPVYAAMSSNLQAEAKSKIEENMEDLMLYYDSNKYGACRKLGYEWGSNMGISNNAMFLLLLDQAAGTENYTQMAMDQLHYLLGVNATGYCFVTGEGSLSPENPHHRPSQVAGTAVPGMLVGGPDSALEDPYAKAVLRGRPAALCYADNAQSYSCNEVTIYWNSPLIFLLSAAENIVIE